MLPKIAHYSGFQSYGDLAYPSLKMGKKSNDSNEVWDQMATREKDDLKLYDNSQRWMSVYKKQLERVVSPEDYQNPTKIPKGLMGFGNEDENKHSAEGGIKKKHELAVPDFALSGTKFKEPFNETSKGVEIFTKTIQNIKNGRAVEHENRQKEEETLLQAALRTKNELKKENVSTGVEHWRSTYSAAVDYPFSTQKATRPQWSLNKTPYSIEKYPRTTEYYNQYGNKATNPVDRLERSETMPPIPKNQDELKKGSTQASFHLPGYTGHVPHEPKTEDDLANGIGSKERTTWMKQNITAYYHTRIPGYAGHRPQCALNDRGKLRETCFSTKGEKY